MKSAEITASACPACGYQVDRTSSTAGEAISPRPGDVSLCANCGDIAVFDDTLRVARISPADLRKVMASEVGHKLREIQIYIADRGPLVG